ncbi:hypothetical protein BH23PAT2_BH23PAT2_01900 [soil metagenome]
MPEPAPETYIESFRPYLMPDVQDTKCVQGEAEFAGTRAQYIIEKPLEHVTDEVPMVIVPGYLGIKQAYVGLRRSIAQLGRSVVTLRPVREQSVRAALHPSYLLNTGALPARSVYGVMSDIQAEHGINSEVVDLIGHSMGGWVASNVAERHPSKVRSVTLVASAGLVGHSTGSFLKKMPAFTRHELAPAFWALKEEGGELRLAVEALRYMVRNPYRTSVEAVGASNCNIRPSLSRLGELGVKTAILNFKADRLIDNQKAEAELERSVDYCKTHPAKYLGHLAPQMYPQLVAKFLTDISDTINHDQAYGQATDQATITYLS